VGLAGCAGRRDDLRHQGAHPPVDLVAYEVVPSRRVQRTRGAAPAAQLRDRGSTKPLGVKIGLPGMTDIDEFKMWFSFGRYGLKAFRWLLDWVSGGKGYDRGSQPETATAV